MIDRHQNAIDLNRIDLKKRLQELRARTFHFDPAAMALTFSDLMTIVEAQDAKIESLEKEIKVMQTGLAYRAVRGIGAILRNPSLARHIPARIRALVN